MKTFLGRICAAAAALVAAASVVAAPPQSVSLTAPAAGSSHAVVSPGGSITLSATATPSSGSQSITLMNFLVNGTSVGTDNTAPFSFAWQPSAPGTYEIIAVASDSSSQSGNTLASSPITVTVSAVRTLSIVTPPANTTIARGSEIWVRANPVLSDGVIKNVRYILNSATTGDVPLGEVTAPPYALRTTFNQVANAYTLFAEMRDSNDVLVATSQAIPLTIATATGAGPTVLLTAPSTGSNVVAGSALTLSATASDTDGTISSVTFYADGEPIAAPDSSAPYSISWTPTATKTYTVTASAVDNQSNIRLSNAATITVLPSGPSVSITAPQNSAGAVVGAPVAVTAAATPPAGASVSQVEFFANGTSVGRATSLPFGITWTPQNTGATTLIARATDSNGVTIESAPVVVNVGNGAPPTVSITAPTAGSSVAAGAQIAVSANAGAAAGLSIASVQFLANGSPIGTDTSSPFTVNWTTPTSPGTVILTAIATDSVGSVTTSTASSVNVVVNATASVTLDLAGGNSIPAGSTRLATATPTPTTGIDRIELLLDETVIATDTVAPYTFLFTAPSSIGLHRLEARVVTTTGLTALSAARAINVTAPTGSPPLIALSTPSANAFVAPNTATTISGTVSDAEGAITGVQVFVNGTALSTAATVSGNTWSVSWTTPTVPGIASIVAIASDAAGNSVATPVVEVNIADSASPAITLAVSPSLANQAAPSTTFPSGAVRNFLATVTPSTGRAIVRVEFFVDGTKIGEDTTLPYTFRYAAPALNDGEQSRALVFAARATDNAGAARDVQLPLLVVQPIGEAPTINLLTPATGAAVVPNTAVSLAATAAANGGTIASVQFFVNGSPLGITSGAPNNTNGTALTLAPYTASFTPNAPGTYVIDAIATDDRGNTRVSNAATITAAFATPTVTITSPNPNATARATPNVPLNLAASAVAPAGSAILLVEFLLDGVQLGADTTAPYTFSWTPTTAQLGQHVLTVRVTDTNSQSTTSAPTNVTVAQATGTPPTVTVTAAPIPTQGLQTLSQVNFFANAFANGANSTLQSVEFFLNDQSIGTATREQTTNIYRLAYDFSRFDFTALVPNETTGRFTVPLYAIARDSNNNQTVSATTQLTISPSTSAPPTFPQPVQNVTNTTTLTQGQQFLAGVFNADSDGTVVNLQMYANGQIVAQAANPFAAHLLQWTVNTPGRYNIHIVATDDTGNTAISSPAIVLTVNATVAPTATITRPEDNSTTATVNSPVFLEGTATSSTPTQVPTLTFVATAPALAPVNIPGQRVGTSTTYRAIWNPTLPGTYTITAQANIGTTQSASTTSRQVVVTNIQGLAPVVNINGGVPTTATTASTANFTATATDSDGSVVSVEFFLNRNSIGFATRDDLANTWRMVVSFAGLALGNTEVVALARDSSGNVAASTTNTINITGATSLPPSVVLEPSTTNAAFNRQIQLRANARDNDSATGNVASVRYFANGTDLGQSTNAGSRYQVNWTPSQSGTYNVYAVATDSTGITRVSETTRITVRLNNPVVEGSAFILQAYQDIANTANINPIVFDQLDEQLASGALSRADIITKPLTANENLAMIDLPGFQAPIQVLAAYYVLMGEWPSPANYTTHLATARGSLANAIGNILNSNEYFAKYGVVPTTGLLNNVNSAIPAATFLARLHQNAGLPPPSAVELTRFISNPTANASLGIARGYNPAGLNAALAEFITIRNASNTALMNKARTAALFYQLIRPQVSMTVEQITARINGLSEMPDTKAVVSSLIGDTLYRHRYVTITRQPTSLTVAARSGAIFSIEADGAAPLTYQWLLNGAPIAGATNALLSLTNVDTTRVGAYTAVVTSAVGTASSDAATLTLSATPTRLANISTRGVTTGGANVMIGGFVVTGANANQTRQMLIRVVGPRLTQAPFNIAGALPDPRLEVYRSGSATPVLTNDNWGTQAGGAAQVTAIQQATTRAGAFALANNSNDAVVLATLAPGLYTVMAHPPANNPTASGVVLIEVYDVTQGGPAGPKASNVSTRGQVGTGNNVMIAGFVVDGAVSRRMLIRGAGPTLANLGVPGVIADPQLTLINQETGQTVRTNDNWASGDDAAIIAQAATAAGAFSFANGSRDAAMLLMLPPGAYTVQLSGVGNTTGVGIVEVYDVDP